VADILDGKGSPRVPQGHVLAGLKLAGLFERAAGIILGDFHQGNNDLSEAVYHALRYHLPPRRPVPIIRLTNFGHIYPIAPLPLHRPVTLRRTSRRGGKPGVKIEIPWGKWK